jgi:osmotically-inducible protein OsmY
MDEPAEYLEERLRRRLAEDGRVSALGVEVSVRGSEVFLAGAVPTAERRRAVGELAEEELPGHVIHNQVTVTELSGSRGAEELG